VAVDRADVVEAELLEQRAREHHALHVLLERLGELVHGTHLREHFLAAAPHGVVQAARQDLREVVVQRADRLADRHLVVVQDHEEVRALRVVERLEGHAGAHRAVADHRDDVPILVHEPGRDRHPSAAEIDVDECAVPNVSYSDSLRRGKARRPFPLRSLLIARGGR
jgi:hypothetical protein